MPERIAAFLFLVFCALRALALAPGEALPPLRIDAPHVVPQSVNTATAAQQAEMVAEVMASLADAPESRGKAAAWRSSTSSS